MPTILERLLALLHMPTDPSERLYWGYLLVFVVLGAWAWRRDGRGQRLLSFLFPKEVWTHRSTAVDVQLFVANRVLAPASLVLGVFGAGAVAVGLARAVPFGGLLPATAATTVVATVGLLLARDFGQFLNHLLHHKVPLLWPLHSVHHSAEVLTPLTLYRKHPLYDVAKGALDAIVVGSFQGLLLVLFAGEFGILHVAGLNAAYAAFLWAGSNVRHSHFWIDWGPTLDHLFISPAMHQVHHSVDERHHDRNFGSVLSIWDWACRTLYVPQGREELTFGLGGGHEARHDTLAQAWLNPLRDQLVLIVGQRPLIAAVAAPLLAFARPACPTPELAPPPTGDDDDAVADDDDTAPDDDDTAPDDDDIAPDDDDTAPDDDDASDDDDSAPCEDENEPNDSVAEATPAAIDTFGYGVLCDGDADWFRMTLNPGDGVDVSVGNGEGVDLALTRHDLAGDLLGTGNPGSWSYLSVNNEFDCEGEALKGTKPVDVIVRVEAPGQAGPLAYEWGFEQWNCDE